MPCRSAMLGDDARQYVRELTEVLATLDLEQVKVFYRKWADAMELPPLPDDQKLEEDMYLMVLELPGLAMLHRTAQEWLSAHGLAVEIRDVNCGKINGAGTGGGACGTGGGRCSCR